MRRVKWESRELSERGQQIVDSEAVERAVAKAVASPVIVAVQSSPKPRMMAINTLRVTVPDARLYNLQLIKYACISSMSILSLFTIYSLPVPDARLYIL